MISEALFSLHSAMEVCRHGIRSVRHPTSSPKLLTRAGTGDEGSPVVESILPITPRASLLWKPLPASRNNSVFCHGLKMRDSFGEILLPEAVPLFSGLVNDVMSMLT